VNRLAAVAILVLAGAAAAGAQSPAPELLKPENRTTSNSGQFIVFGGTRAQRSDLARRGDELAATVGRELRDSGPWKTAILMVLSPGDGFRFRQKPVMVQVFDAAEAGRKLQVDIAPGALADGPGVDLAIVRALLLERSLRRQKFQGSKFVEPPGWMVGALLAAHNRGAQSSAVYASLLQGKGMPQIDRFLRQAPWDLRGRARELHAAQSLALFEGLADLPDGRRRIADNLTLAEPSSEPVERFAQTWPELASAPDKLARVWAVAVARFSSPAKMEFLGAEETGRRLARLLEGLEGAPEVGAEGLPPAEALLALSRTDEGRFRLARTAEEMQRLGFRSHPLYAPLVREYQEQIDGLARKKRRGFERRFEESEELRLSLDQRAGEITDFLNWFQASYEPEPEVVVDTTSLRRASDAKTRRNDRISRYLDSVEQRGW
jgi:hypothetical protein